MESIVGLEKATEYFLSHFSLTMFKSFRVTGASCVSTWITAIVGNKTATRFTLQ